MTSSKMGAALKLTGVSVRFGGVTALSDVTLHFPTEPGISAIIGPNGAGKTTLFNVMTGIVRPVTGQVTVAGRDMTGLRPDEVFRAGVSRTFQGVRLFEHLDVEQNVRLAARSACGGGRMAAWFDFRDDAGGRTRRALDEVGLARSAWRMLPEELTLLQRRQVEIARALTVDPVALLMDEPAAGLNTAEKADLSRLLKAVSIGRSCRIVVVEHDMKLVMSLAERIAVMNFGRLLCEGTPADIQTNPAVVEAYLGAGSVHG